MAKRLDDYFRDANKVTKLSIIVLSSGREETIERCLQSIKDTFWSFPYEIIAVDTDPKQNEDIYKILCKYCANIVKFRWCDDFSAARNAGLSVCRGEWVMYIDDDEWILDFEDILRFLNSSDSENYHWANLKVRNYVESGDCKKYEDAFVTRLVKKENGVRFYGKIHEELHPVVGEPYVSSSYLGHSGYIFKDDAERRKHAERNIKLLRKMISKEPYRPRWWVQMLQEYGSIEEYGMMRKLSESYIGMVKRIKVTDYNRDYIKNVTGLFVSARILADIEQKKMDKAFVSYRKYAKKYDYGVIADAQLDLFGAVLYFARGDIENAKLKVAGYVNNLEKYKEDPALYSRYQLYFFEKVFCIDNLVCVNKMVNHIIENE